MSDERMTVNEAERLIGLWCAGEPLYDMFQWREAMHVLKRELAYTRVKLTRARERLTQLDGQEAQA